MRPSPARQRPEVQRNPADQTRSLRYISRLLEWIEKVNAPQMYGMYLLRKEEMQLDQGGVIGVDEC